MNPMEIREAVEYIDECLRDITERGLADEQTAFEDGIAERARLIKLLERHDALAALAEVPERQERSASPTIIRSPEIVDVLNDRNASPAQLADAATRALEEKVDADNMDHVRSVLKRHRADTDWSRGIAVRASDEYASAFAKVITHREMFLEPEERAALAVGTNTQGGFMVPTFLDPTIILTNAGTQNAVRPIARQVTLSSGNVWNGVSSAGVTASFDAELAEVSDDSPSVARVSIPLYTARAFVAASLEAFDDIDALAADVLMLFADARDRLEADAHVNGSGSGAPTGIVTALDANTNYELTSTTAATLGLVDLDAMYYGVSARFRGNASWLTHPRWLAAIKDLGTAISASYSGDLRDPLAGRILGRPVVESDDFPTVTTTTALDNRVIFGDFSNYVIVDKPGSLSVEFIPVLMGTTSARPIGARGWFAHWRTGGGVTGATGAFRLLQDKTSA